MRSTLSRGCRPCIRAKKRCSRALPKCARCLQKQLPCAYQNEPLGKSTNSAAQHEAEDTIRAVDTQAWQSQTLPNRRRHWENHNGVIHWTNGDSIIRMTEPAMLLPMDAESHEYIVQALTLYPLEFSQTSSTSFIHHKAYQCYRPTSLSIAKEICRIRVGRPCSSGTQSSAMLRDLTKALLSTADTSVSFVDTLAFVQSLCLLQILSLFSPDASVEEHDEGLLRRQLLIHWTHKLWQSAPTELPNTLTKYEAYVIAEAVRRTILTSHEIKGTYRVGRTGFFRHTIFVETLPFGGNVALWECGQTIGESAWCEHTKYPWLLSYRELCDVFDAGLMKTATPFERMLLVGCKGKVAVEEKLGPLYSTDRLRGQSLD